MRLYRMIAAALLAMTIYAGCAAHKQVSAAQKHAPAYGDPIPQCKPGVPCPPSPQVK
jgi:hypothetical protein